VSPEHAALIAKSDDVARAHGADTLHRAVATRLRADGRNALAERIVHVDARVQPVDWKYFATTLVARLRADGREVVAAGVVSLLGGAGVDAGSASIVIEPTLAMEPRRLRAVLATRLHDDGHVALADHLHTLILTDGRPSIGEWASSGGWSWSGSAGGADATLAIEHDADVLLRALLLRLRADGHGVMAGRIMELWLRDVVGPIIDPRRLAAVLDARLRAEGRAELADDLAALVGGAAVDHDPADLMARWHASVAGPIIDARPLADVLVASLRTHEAHDGRACRLGALAAPLAALLSVAENK
jgi:hypothetical protein